jgi:glycosyltransferase involved in cell wall biosynthesis
MRNQSSKTLAVFSDVKFSPQLIAILRELNHRGKIFRVILIGESESKIAIELKELGWDLKVLRKRGKLGSLVNFFVLSVEIKRFRPEAVFTSGQFATVIGMLSGKMLSVPQRIFIRHHSSFHHKYKKRLGLLLDLLVNRVSTKIVAVSAVVKNILIESEGVDPEKLILIHNGIELTKFQRVEPFRDWTSSKEPNRVFKIGVISRLTEWKGVEYAAKAFVRLQKEFPHSRLHIVGAFSDSYSNVINILSHLDQGLYELQKENLDIPNFLHGIDVFVHVPIGHDDEAFGIVYIEALASGIPCIFTRSGVLNELEQPERYADIVRYRSSEEIYLSLKKILQSTGDPKSEVSDLWLNKFSLTVMSKEYSELLLGGLN